ncbi:MAG: twin-arginine translocase subunit TatC [Sphingobacteriales bacterium]|nr:MAG: twin-arginine translocase subunit TatC [Sphingobacteriales bacterium]
MSVTDHIEELRWHIIRSLLMVIVCSVVIFFNIEWIFDRIILGPAHVDFVSYQAMCSLARLVHVDGLCMKQINMQFQNTELSGQFMMSFSSSFIIGFIIASPYVFWEIWRFIKPALTSKEANAASGLVLWASILFFSGVLFAYFVVVPFTVNFFAAYQLSPSFENIITMSNYYDTLNDMILGMGLVFELPVVVYFLSRIGMLTPKLMREKRKYAIIVILVLAAVITPPDWLSIWLVAIPLTFLYEASIKISGRVLAKKVA